jgi:hypothetical protein
VKKTVTTSTFLAYSGVILVIECNSSFISGTPPSPTVKTYSGTGAFLESV